MKKFLGFVCLIFVGCEGEPSTSYGPPSSFPFNSGGQASVTSSSSGGFGGSSGSGGVTSMTISTSGTISMGGAGGQVIDPDQLAHDLCIHTNGTPITQQCCSSVEDWPNTCVPVECGSSLECMDANLMTKICDCSANECFDQLLGCMSK